MTLSLYYMLHIKKIKKKKNTYFRPFHVRVPSNLFNKLLGVSQTISPSN